MNILKEVVIYGGMIVYAVILSLMDAPNWAVVGLSMIFFHIWRKVIEDESC